MYIHYIYVYRYDIYIYMIYIYDMIYDCICVNTCNHIHLHVQTYMCTSIYSL